MYDGQVSGGANRVGSGVSCRDDRPVLMRFVDWGFLRYYRQREQRRLRAHTRYQTFSLQSIHHSIRGQWLRSRIMHCLRPHRADRHQPSVQVRRPRHDRTGLQVPILQILWRGSLLQARRVGSWGCQVRQDYFTSTYFECFSSKVVPFNLGVVFNDNDFINHLNRGFKLNYRQILC